VWCQRCGSFVDVRVVPVLGYKAVMFECSCGWKRIIWKTWG
jgi:hypothetical protein